MTRLAERHGERERRSPRSAGFVIPPLAVELLAWSASLEHELRTFDEWKAWQ